MYSRVQDCGFLKRLLVRSLTESSAEVGEAPPSRDPRLAYLNIQCAKQRF